MRLLPRDEKFFDLFTAVATYTVEAARLQQELLRTDHNRRGVIVDQIKRLEHQADQVTHDVVSRLDRVFITPLDREDIHLLASRLDDVIDLIDGTVRRLSLFKIAAPTPLSRSLSKVVVQTTGELVEAVSRLRTQKGVMERCIRIKQLENEADVVYHDAIASLFAEELPAIEVIKWKDVYDTMERTVDSCVVVAHVLESVVLKHS